MIVLFKFYMTRLQLVRTEALDALSDTAVPHSGYLYCCIMHSLLVKSDTADWFMSNKRKIHINRNKIMGIKMCTGDSISSITLMSGSSSALCAVIKVLNDYTDWSQ